MAAKTKQAHEEVHTFRNAAGDEREGTWWDYRRYAWGHQGYYPEEAFTDPTPPKEESETDEAPQS